MSDRSERLLRALAAVPEDSVLAPVWQPASRAGFVYLAAAPEPVDAEMLEDLETLASQDYLERTFVERLSLCPRCASHALNVHETCPSCASSNLMPFKALFHFRCGFVGPVEAFAAEPAGLRCPKCNRILADLGTDHDSPGEYFQCRACASMFQVPTAGARCLSCGAVFSGGAMGEEMGYRDVFAYRITARGKAALREKRLASGEPA
ncbi:MAG: TackOD1 domain-containing metal-binding protein [Vulcanimicrobiaceae bacterium]